MYGVPMEERTTDLEKKYLGRKKHVKGTYFFGRMLISMSLSES